MVNIVFPLVKLFVALAANGGRYRNHKTAFFQTELLIPPPQKLNAESRYGDPLPVLYTNDPSSALQWLEEYVLGPLEDDDDDESIIAIGFDVESRPKWPNSIGYLGPATVQLSVLESSMILQIADQKVGKIKDLIPILDLILSNPSIIKVGVGINDDMIELCRFSSLLNDIRSRLDISYVGSNPKDAKSLKHLAGAVLQIDMNKSRRIATSNWAKVPLSEQQIRYAARDAWVAAAVLAELANIDPQQFALRSLLDLISKDEVDIPTLDVRARDRKVAKTRWKELHQKEKEEPSDLSVDEIHEKKHLEEKIRQLAPPRAPKFIVDGLDS